MARGTEQHKRNDLCAVPLCREHHGKRQSMGTAAFNGRHGVDLWREAWRLATGWLAKEKEKENQNGK